MVFIFLLLMMAVLIAGYTSYEYQKKSLEEANQDRLSAIADLKAQQVQGWLEERWGNIALIQENPLVASKVDQFILNPQSTEIHDDLLSYLRSLQFNYDYHLVLLMDGQAQPLLSAPEQSLETSDQTRALALEALASGETVFSDLYRERLSGKVFLDFLAPIRISDQGTARAVGVILLRINPQQSLFPLINLWPTNSPTGEAVLVRREDKQVVFLSELRMANRPAFDLSLPLDTRQLVEGNALLINQEKVSQGVDYRGIQVFAAVRQVPGTPWRLVVKVDQEEIYASLRERQFLVLVLTAALIIAAGTMAGMLWRLAEARLYKQLYLAEVRRQALSEQLSYLSRYANDMILLVDQTWTILEANDRAQEAMQYSISHLRDHCLPDYCPLEHRAGFFQQVSTLDTRDGLLFEMVLVRNDGISFPVECSARTIDIDDKKYYQLIIRDISDRRQAENRLRESEKRFRLFYEQAPVGYQSLDAEGCLVDVNDYWLEAFGYQRKDVLDKPLADFFTPPSRERFLKGLPEWKACGEVRGQEFEFICGDQSILFVSLTGKVSYEERGHFKQLHCILYDVTERRRAEEQTRRMNAELERRVLERTSQLEDANKELEAFSYSVSHDLRAPLRAINGFSRILSEDFGAGLPAEAQRYLNLVRENTQTMSCLIDNLLAFSRLSRQPLKKQRIDPNELVQQCLDSLSAERDGRKIDFQLHPLPRCQADPALLKQVFVNLLSNAVKFTSKKDEAVIEVGCLQENHETIFFIKDNGVGFDMQYAPKLFGVFQRLHRVEDYDGTGVGLAIVQRIIHRHGGRVWAEGEVDDGATFCFTLEENHKQ